MRKAEPGLWAGADVQWSGPDEEIDGLWLRRGDRAVVVDPGRHAVKSFSPLVAVDGPGPKARGDVVIRTATGKVASVPRRHLELVAPEHPLSPDPDGAVATWWIDQLEPWPSGKAITVASFVPRGFQAVGRVLHPGGRRSGQLDHATAGPLVDVLTQATSTAANVYFAVWEGWGDTPSQRFPGAAVLRTPGREHFLLRGPLSGALTSVAVSGSEPVSGFWWPEDRAWFVATEIDFDWTFVAGNQQLLDALLAHPGLEVTPTRYDATASTPENPASP